MKFSLLFITIIFLLLSQKLYCQSYTYSLADSNISLTGEIKIIDSQYLLILKLSVKNKSKLMVDKSRFYDYGEKQGTHNRIFLKKLIRKVYANIYVAGFREQGFTEDITKKTEVTELNPVMDTLDLGYYYPLEIGEYSISGEIVYWQDKVRKIARSEEVPFTVFFIPMKGLF